MSTLYTLYQAYDEETYTTNEDVMRRVGMDCLHDIVRCQRGLDGHILCLVRDQIALIAMEYVPEGGSRNRGRPTKTWRKTFKEDLEQNRNHLEGCQRNRKRFFQMVKAHDPMSGKEQEEESLRR